MALRILFVHGTGVRQPAYSDGFLRARAKSRLLECEVDFEECYWGGPCGARLNAEGASIPMYDTTRAHDGEVEAEDLELTLWEMLYRDPLFECRMLQASLSKASFIASHSNLPIFVSVSRGLGDEAAGSLSVLTRAEEGLTAREVELSVEQIDSAMRWLAAQSEFTALLEAAAEASQDMASYAPPAARAVVARAIQVSQLGAQDGKDLSRRSALPFATDSALRDALVDELATIIGGSDRGFMGAVIETATAPLKGLALYGATWFGGRQRGSLMDAISFAAGDVLVYQGRGLAIRDFIRRRIRETSAEVILAHSLGGIACVDLLVERPEPSVKLLVTAGSQSPFLYEIGALHSLPFKAASTPDDRLPAAFPRWLNVYDTRDFLSFVGQGIFGNRVTDVRVNNRQPFPQSHSGYWTNPATWEAICKSLEGL